MKIKESAENYLEAILMIKNKKGYARSIDVANHLNFSKPSVSVAMKSFREEGYITVDNDGNLDLTEKGQKIAAKMYERHETIAKTLMLLGVSEETAREALRLAGHKLPIKWKFVKKETEEGGEQVEG